MWRESVKSAKRGNAQMAPDGDTLNIIGWCQGDGYRVGFGQVSGLRVACRMASSRIAV
jgi:fumarylacetoacetase